ncbi:hypothetical protein SSX86_009113 [Deinandra increscens subsp. villosa]|uniref:DUF6821 domain-containing protein n=1 Tax=Deinandra increscens subsp. villosa TaxID=3103831 RepID=A0AAP0DGP9_9ASTR
MDLEDEGWVSVPYGGLLEVHNDGDEKYFLRKYVKSPTEFYKQHHFNASHMSQDYVEDEPVFEMQLDHKEEVKEIIKRPILIAEPKDTSYEPESNKDPIFKIFLEKEKQFFETKMGFLRESSQEPDFSRTEMGLFQYEEMNGNDVVNWSSSPKMIKEEVVVWKESNQRLNFWKLGLNGIGVFCSLGMAAATICIILCGNGKKQNQKLKFQIHPENKRIKQVVQTANEAISAVRGVPLVNAKITYGGHYEVPLAS